MQRVVAVRNVFREGVAAVSRRGNVNLDGHSAFLINSVHYMINVNASFLMSTYYLD